jgi:putative transcriptional regulator
MDTTRSDLLDALETAQAWLRGEEVEGVRVHRSVDIPDLKALRTRLDLTQEGFASAFGIPLATLRGWEIGRYQPDATAVSYLHVINRIPGPVRSALSGGPPSGPAAG